MVRISMLASRQRSTVGAGAGAGAGAVVLCCQVVGLVGALVAAPSFHYHAATMVGKAHAVLHFRAGDTSIMPGQLQFLSRSPSSRALRPIRTDENCWSLHATRAATHASSVRATSSRLEATAGNKETTVAVKKTRKQANDTRKARVKVRQAQEADFEGVAKLRTVIVPLGMDGAVGFMGSKVAIDDPMEAKRRRLMAKVADLVNGDVVALIALEGNDKNNIVGAVDCSIQPAVTARLENGLVHQAAGPSQWGHAIRRGTVGRRDFKTETQHERQQAIGRNTRQDNARSGPGNGSSRPSVFLGNLFVLPEHRRQGIGRELVKGAEAFAKAKGAGTICMEVARSNASAMDLYRSCGFKERGAGGSIGEVVMIALGMGNTQMTKDI